MAKRAFLVLGPESSGNRYVTKCFMNAGCYGHEKHGQMLDNSFEYATDTIVLRRSLPHGADFNWPNLDALLLRLRDNGYKDVKVFALIRNQHCTVRSQIEGDKDGKDTHSKTPEMAQRKIVGAIRRIASFIMENNLPFYFMTYESLAQPELFTAILNEWGLDGSKIEEFVDGNVRHIQNLVKNHPPFKTS